MTDWHSNTCARLKLILVLSFSAVALAAQAATVSAQTSVKYDALNQEFQQKLRDLDSRCVAGGLQIGSATVSQLIFSRDPNRRYYFIPAEQNLWPTDSSKTGGNTWEKDFRKLRTSHAAALLGLVHEALAKSESMLAFAWLHEVCVLDPDNDEARRILGYRKVDGRWITGKEPISSKTATSQHKLLDWWWKDSYLVVESPHYQITSRASSTETVALANHLERWRIVWRQAFFDYWATAEYLAEVVGGEAPSAAQRKYKVMFFANRNDYVTALRHLRVEGGEMSTGFYSDRHQCLFLYMDAPPPLDTWKHEQAHQLFQEIPFAHGNPVERSHVWLLEGIALYFESLVDWGQYASLGGFDHGRLQFARINVTREGFFEPFDSLTRLSRSDFQRSSDVSKLYSQAAGMTHFLLSAQEGAYRPAVVPLLKLMYQRRAKLDSLEKLTGQSSEQLETQYKEFLAVDRDNVAEFLSDPERRTELALGFSKVDHSIGPMIARCENLRWLQLSSTQIDDDLGPSLTKLTRLEQLFLDNTKVTDVILNSIAELTQLEELDLAHTKITDEGLKLIAKLPRLKALWLSDTQITDEGLKQLSTLQQLQLLSVSRTKVTNDALQQLKRQLPQLQQVISR